MTLRTGKWFSLIAERGGEQVEVTRRKYSAIDTDGQLTRQDVVRHTYATTLDEWGEEYEYVVDSWVEPGIVFGDMDAGCYTITSLAVSSTPAGAPDQLIPLGSPRAVATGDVAAIQISPLEL